MLSMQKNKNKCIHREGVRVTSNSELRVGTETSCWYQLPSSRGTGWLPACEFDGQYEQRAEHDSPTEESRPPGHQEQHLAERLSHPAQHYSQSSARRPIYTPRWKLDTYIPCNKKAWWAKAGLTGEQTVVLNWIGRGRCWCPGHSNTVTPTFLSHVDFFTSAKMTARERQPSAGDGV